MLVPPRGSGTPRRPRPRPGVELDSRSFHDSGTPATLGVAVVQDGRISAKPMPCPCASGSVPKVARYEWGSCGCFDSIRLIMSSVVFAMGEDKGMTLTRS